MWIMEIKESLICPKCNGVAFEMKREATYLYTYKIDTPLTNEWSNEDEALPFLFDNREQLDSKEYIECKECGARYSYNLDKGKPKIHLTILQKAIRADSQKEPEFWG